jgi:hypothetical protein
LLEGTAAGTFPGRDAGCPVIDTTKKKRTLVTKYNRNGDR